MSIYPAMNVYATCARPFDAELAGYPARIADVARWTEAAGLDGLLVFTDHSAPDPWLVAQIIVERTERIVPLAAVQPSYMHPYTAARMVSTISTLYGRRVDLNMVTGGYVPHLVSLGNDRDHDARYDNLVEYGQLMLRLLDGGPVSSKDGSHYPMVDVGLRPNLPPQLRPRVFVAGTSDAAAGAAASLNATRLIYPRHLSTYEHDSLAIHGAGIRIGIVARESSAKAWRLANKRYPPDAKAGAVREFAAALSGSQWHDELWKDSSGELPALDPYWMHPFRASTEYCPFLVGSYDEVAEQLARYLDLGGNTLILNHPWEEEDLHHARIVLDRVCAPSSESRVG